MSVSRKTFCERIATIKDAVANFNLQDLPPVPANLSHNKSARVIRNGLAVQCFNIFEDFVRGRTEEILLGISSSGVAFASLPEELRKASTVDVIQAIQFQLKLQDKANRISYVQDYSDKISSTKLAVFQLPDLAFFHSGSNISKEQFRDALGALSVDKPWSQISGLCSRFGISGLPAEDVFQSFAQRRHNAAHDPNASVSEVDLQQSLTDATGLASCFDILASHCARLIATLSSPIPATTVLIKDHATIPLRFVKYLNGQFREIKERGKKAIQSDAQYSPLIAGAAMRSVKENGMLVVLDATGALVEWVV